MSDSNDGEIRFSLLELDLPGVPLPGADPPQPVDPVPIAPLDPPAQITESRDNPLGIPVWIPPPRTSARGARNGPIVPTAAQKAHAEKLDAEREARARVDEMISLSLTSNDGRYPNGAICAWVWDNSEPRTWHEIAAVAELTGFTAPAPKSLKAIASSAVKSLQDNEFKVTVISRGSAWSVFRPSATQEVGASVGPNALIATLTDDDELILQGPSDLCATVREAFDSARDGALISNGEISTWLNGILASWRAVPIAYGRWLAGSHVERWIVLAGACADIGLPIPRRPCAPMTRDDFREEIQSGLRREVSRTVDGIIERREKAQAKEKDFTFKGAATAVAEIVEIRGKLDLYEKLTGPLTEERERLTALETDLDAIVNPSATRFALIAAELEREREMAK